MNIALDELFKSTWKLLWSPEFAGNKNMGIKKATVKNFDKPGVYLISKIGQGKRGSPVRLEDVYYVGMSNSQKGVKDRMKQFVKAIYTGRGHSGGNRLFKKNGRKLPEQQLLFTCVTFEDIKSVKKGVRDASDLMKMGEVAKLEHDVLAYLLSKGISEKDLLNVN